MSRQESSEEISPPSTALVTVPVSTWRPILEASSQIVLYNPTSHALTITQSSLPIHQNQTGGDEHVHQIRCPYCARPLKNAGGLPHSGFTEDRFNTRHTRRAPNYFQLLELANTETQSRPSSPPLEGPSGSGPSFSTESMAQGYFRSFFREERRLGMGANGSVYLCQHVLDGNYLGHFAVKKIAVGHSHEYLLQILREVRLLETLRHPNIVTYHHTWLETATFSSFGPPIPTLHVLMEWAECGSLDDFIDGRMGKATLDRSKLPSGLDEETVEANSRAARIKAFKEAKHLRNTQHGPERTPGNSAIHLLSAEEIKSFTSDIVSGLAFLHERSVLHLDLKLGNVLLTMDDNSRIIPRAMLSDFGTSQDMIQTPRVRSGNTGTIEYSAPEALARDALTGLLLPLDSKSDMWSLGMIIYKLIFFRLPYPEVVVPALGGEIDAMERQVLEYPGFSADPEMVATCKRRGLSRAWIVLLEGLLNRNQSSRPTAERVLGALKEGKLDPLRNTRSRDATVATVALRRPEPLSTSSSSGSESRQPSQSPTSQRNPLQENPGTQDDVIDGEPHQSQRHRSPHRLSLPKDETIPLRILFLSTIDPIIRYEFSSPVWKIYKTTLLLGRLITMNNACQLGKRVNTFTQIGLISLAAIDIWDVDRSIKSLGKSIAWTMLYLCLIFALRTWDYGFCIVE